MSLKDGSVSLHEKEQPIYQLYQSSQEAIRLRQTVLPDAKEDAMALHFDWLEGLQAQIQEVQGTRDWLHIRAYMLFL